MRLAAGIATWQDGAALERTRASLVGVVDHVYVADGPIRGAAPAELVDIGPWWPSLAAKRDALLWAARLDEIDWLLTIDADEELHRGADLRRWLELWTAPAFPLPFNVEPGWTIACPWKVLHVADWRRHVAQSYYLENTAGDLVRIDQPPAPLDAHGLPYLTHHPELRPEGRRDVRMNVLEQATDGTPAGAAGWTIPIPAPLSATLGAMYYCPGCGARYSTAGTCTNQHEPIELEKLPDEPALADAGDDVEPANGTLPYVDLGTGTASTSSAPPAEGAGSAGPTE